MEGLQKAFRSIAQDSKLVIPSPSPSSSSSLGGRGSSSVSADKSAVLVTRPPRQAATLWMYSKVAAVSFVAGIVVGFALNRRIRRWAARLLKKIRDD